MKNLLLALITLVFASSMANGADVPARAQSCAACHGQAGVSVSPLWPNLAGQKAGYLEAQLKAFRDGQRVNAAMAPFVNGLSGAQITALANYYSELPLATSANGGPKLVASGENLSVYCKACHGMKGIPAASVWPNLAGQHATYLEIQLAAYKKGTRTHPHMETVVAPFGNTEFKALAAYYSQLTP